MTNNEQKRILVTGGSGFIGTNLVEFYLKRGYEVLNLDTAAPRNPDHASIWRNMDILDRVALIKTIGDFSPIFLLHFAARTDLGEKKTIDGYATNIEGVKNIIDAVRAATSIKRVIFTSSQLVCRLGYQPQGDEDYCPNTLYGMSKVEGEKLIRSSDNLQAIWTIIRPTSIWGPWFAVPYRDFFNTIQKGLYVHTRGVATHRQWGFVGNSIHQIDKLITAPEERVNRKMFYLADYDPIDLQDFANAVQKAFKSKRIMSVPSWLMRSAATGGDLLHFLGWKNPPLTSFRLRNLWSDEIQDITPLKKIAGALPFSYQEGIEQTVKWIHDTGLEKKEK